MPKQAIFMIENEFGKIDYYVCPFTISESVVDNWLITDCAAGCGNRLTYPKQLKKKPPKICIYCDGWLSNCVGEA